MQHKKYNIELSQNEAFELTIVFTDSSGQPIPLSSVSGDTKMQVRTQNDVNSTLIATVNQSTTTLSNFAVPTFYFPDSDDNMFVFYIPQQSIEGSPFNAMEANKNYYYDIVATVNRVPKSPKILLAGIIQISSGITDVP